MSDQKEPQQGVWRMTASMYAILCLYEHGHISEGKAAKLMECGDIVTFRLQREKLFKEMCRVLELSETASPLPMP